MTPSQVLAADPTASAKPFYVREHANGLALPAGEDAWLHAIALPDGSWSATGYLGTLGDTSTVIDTYVLTGPSPLYASFCAAANQDVDGARGIVSALSEAARTVRTRADLRDLLAEFPALTVDQWGGMCPVQAEGTVHGYPFYFRYRHASASLTVGGDLHHQALWSSGMVYGDDEDQGWLDTPAFMHLMRTLIRDLSRAPIWWEFAGTRTSNRSDADPDTLRPSERAGAPTTMGGWGHTPHEAWERLHHPENLYQVTPQQWQTYVAEHGLTPVTVTTDEREFPANDPAWDAPAT